MKIIRGGDKAQSKRACRYLPPDMECGFPTVWLWSRPSRKAMLRDVNLSCGWPWPWPLGHVYPWMSRKASVREVNTSLWRMQRCPFSVECLGAVSIVDGNVWVNMWETAYALPVWRRTHGGRSCVLARGVQKWIIISLLLSWFVCRNTNSVKRVMKSLIVGTTSIYREST